MKDPDVQLIRFFNAVIEDEIKLHSSNTHKGCLKKLKSLHAPEAFKKADSRTDLSLSSLRCAYAYLYGPCLTSTLVKHLERLFKKKSLLLQTIVLRGTLTICCISTGFATEFVAMLIVLEDLLRKYYSRTNNVHTKPLKIEVVVVNTTSDCNQMIEKMAEKLPHIVDVSRLSLKLRFISTDLTKSLTDDVKEAINQSDFVTMIHFLSSIHDDVNSLQMIQEIIPFIREGGVLFLLDSPGFHLCDTLRRIIDTSEHMKEIYGPLSYDIHRLSFLCMKECLKLYSRYYGWRYCDLESKNYVCAWYKRTSSSESANSISFTRLINDPSLFH